MTRFVTPESTTHAFRSNARVKLLHNARVIALSNRAGIRQTRSYGCEGSKVSQAKPMTNWCLPVIALVALFMAVGVALFYMPGQGRPLQQQGVPVVKGNESL